MPYNSSMEVITMLNVVLFEPEIPGNTGNIMRTCVASNTKLHLIKPLGFSLDEKYIKRSGVNYIDKCIYEVYENIDEFFNKNKGAYFFFTRYGHNVRALNLSNSVAICVYEVLRQKNYEGLLFDEPHKSKTFIEDTEN